jgi:hypothetical protein
MWWPRSLWTHPEGDIRLSLVPVEGGVELRFGLALDATRVSGHPPEWPLAVYGGGGIIVLVRRRYDRDSRQHVWEAVVGEHAT